MKAYFVKDLLRSAGLTGESLFLLMRKDQRVTRANKPYLDLVLADTTGEISAKIWSDALTRFEIGLPGEVYLVEFEVNSYQGKNELAVRKMSKVTDYEESDFIQVPDHINPDNLKKELAKRIDSVRDFQLRALLDAFFDDQEFYNQYTTVPAGDYVHHDYRHGLLQHCLEMLTILDSTCEIYPDINKDLLITAALLHDIGKLRECHLTPLGVFERTMEGKMMGHIVLGAEMVRQRLPKDFPAETETLLIHLILSHQGKLEFGSPVVPSTREAIALHQADVMSMFLNIAESMRRNGLNTRRDEASASLFSEYNKYLGTSIFLGE